MPKHETYIVIVELFGDPSWKTMYPIATSSKQAKDMAITDAKRKYKANEAKIISCRIAG